MLPNFYNILKAQHEVTMYFAESQEYAMTLPPEYQYKFLKGIRYQTGSDYSPLQLSTTIGDLVDRPCGNCFFGSVWSSNGPDDYDRDICEVCDGTGKATL